jgi:uncharacterized protein (UPF0333 family)
MKFNKKGQGALEYLLLIGGAVLIAVIVIALLVGMGSSSNKDTAEGGERISSAIAGTAVGSVLQSADCNSEDYLNISYVHNGGDVNLMVNGDINTSQPVLDAGKSTQAFNGTGVCSAANATYQISLFTTASSGATATSNTIIARGE